MGQHDATPSKKDPAFWENGSVPWFTIDDLRGQGFNIKSTKQAITQHALDTTSVKLLPKGSTLLCCTASVGACAYSEIPLTTNQQFNGLVIKSEHKSELNSKFLFWMSLNLENDLKRNSGSTSFDYISVTKVKEIEIPLPPIEVQQEIVEELEGYQKIIDGCRQVVENYKPTIDIDPSWEMVELGNICELTMGQSPNSEFYNSEGDGLEFHQGKRNFTNLYVNHSGVWASQFNKVAEEESILMSVRAPVGPVNITKRKIALGRGLCSIKSNQECSQMYLFYILQASKERLTESSHGSTFESINKNQLEDFEIPLPSIEVQREIAEELKGYQKIVDGNSTLIEIYTQKIQDRISKVWGEDEPTLEEG